jgi:hypothetical protein
MKTFKDLQIGDYIYVKNGRRYKVIDNMFACIAKSIQNASTWRNWILERTTWLSTGGQAITLKSGLLCMNALATPIRFTFWRNRKVNHDN